MPLKQKQRTRKQYLLEIHFEVDESDIEAMPENFWQNSVESRLAREDERIWACHRDPLTDLTQKEARDRAQQCSSPNYGPYNISQSTVSRKLSDMDRTMLTQPVESLNTTNSLIGEMVYEDYKRVSPELLEVHRKRLARRIVDTFALSHFTSYEYKTPEWAQERFPELDPNIGRKYGMLQGYHEEDDPDEVHEKQ